MLTVLWLVLPRLIIEQEKYSGYFPLSSRVHASSAVSCTLVVWLPEQGSGSCKIHVVPGSQVRSYENNPDALTTWKHTDFKILEVLDMGANFLKILPQEYRSHVLFLKIWIKSTLCSLSEKPQGYYSLAIKLSWSTKYIHKWTKVYWAWAASSAGLHCCLVCSLHTFFGKLGELGNLLCCVSGRRPQISHEAGIEGTVASSCHGAHSLKDACSSAPRNPFPSTASYLPFLLLRNSCWAPAMCQPLF